MPVESVEVDEPSRIVFTEPDVGIAAKITFVEAEAGFAAMFGKLKALLARWNGGRGTLHPTGVAALHLRETTRR